MATSSPSVYRDLHSLIKDMDCQYMLFMDIMDMDTDTCHTDILCQKGKLKLRPKLRPRLCNGHTVRTKQRCTRPFRTPSSSPPSAPGSTLLTSGSRRSTHCLQNTSSHSRSCAALTQRAKAKAADAGARRTRLVRTDSRPL